MSNFIEVALPTNQFELASLALEKLTEEMRSRGYAEWQPQPADITTILLESAAPIAADTMSIASPVPNAIFRRYGEKVAKLEYRSGSPASGIVTFTIPPNSAGERPPFTLPEGFQLAAGSLGFFTVAEASATEGQETLEVEIQAVANGPEYDGVSGQLEAVESFDRVESPIVQGETGGGTEAESEDEYLERLAAYLGLQSPAPITATDFATIVHDVPAGVITSGDIVGRSTSIDGYDAITSEHNKERYVTTWVTLANGEPMSTPDMEQIEAWLKSLVEVNFEPLVRAPNYTTVYVTAKVHALPNYSSEAVIANCKAAVEAYLSPEKWGNPESSTTGSNSWLNEGAGFNIVRYNQIIGALQAARGVAYVFAGSEGLKIGTTASPSGTSDITMTGPAPLPKTVAGGVIVTVA